MFLRYIRGIKTLQMEYISNKIYLLSSQRLKNLYRQKILFKENVNKIFALYVILPLYFNFSDFKTRGNIYIHIFSPLHIPRTIILYA